MDQSLGYNKQYFITALYDVTAHGKGWCWPPERSNMEDGRMTQKSTLPHLYWSIIINFFCNTFKRCDFTFFFSKTFSSLAFQSNKSKTLTHFKIIIKTILLNNSWHLEKTVYLVIKPNRLESVWENIKFTLCPWQNNYSYCSACNQYEIS